MVPAVPGLFVGQSTSELIMSVRARGRACFSFLQKVHSPAKKLGEIKVPLNVSLQVSMLSLHGQIHAPPPTGSVSLPLQ